MENTILDFEAEIEYLKELDKKAAEHEHLFIPPSNDDEQQCDTDCKDNWHRCKICGKTRSEIRKEMSIESKDPQTSLTNERQKPTTPPPSGRANEPGDGTKMEDEGCPNPPLIDLEDAKPIDLDKVAPVVHPRIANELIEILPKKKGKPVGADDVKHFSLMEVRPFLKSINARLTRKRYAETTLREYLTQIQPTTLCEQYLEFYDKYPFHKEVCAGARHHHWWKGGLEQHLCEMIGIGMDIMELYPGDFTFTKSDLIIAVFLHDFAKIWTYRYITDDDRTKHPKKFGEKQVFTYTDGQFNILDAESKILLELSRSDITPTDEQWSAVIFAEGGFSAAMYDFCGRSETGNTVFAKNHLATFTAVLDQWSAQILGRSIV